MAPYCGLKVAVRMLCCRRIVIKVLGISHKYDQILNVGLAVVATPMNVTVTYQSINVHIYFN